MEIRLFRGLSEYPANRNIIFRLYRFSFHKPIKSRLVRGRLYLPFTPCKSTTKSVILRSLNSGFRFKLLHSLSIKDCGAHRAAACIDGNLTFTHWTDFFAGFSAGLSSLWASFSEAVFKAFTIRNRFHLVRPLFCVKLEKVKYVGRNSVQSGMERLLRYKQEKRNKVT